MKKYIKSSIDNQTLSVAKEEIEDYILNYYGELGYAKDECFWPECITEYYDTVDGKEIYKMYIEFFALDQYDVEDICNELDVLAGLNGLPIKMYKDFKWDGEYTFTGYVIER